jgi:hypothetical protein
MITMHMLIRREKITRKTCVDGSIILKWILGKQGLRMWVGFTRLGIETGGRLL